jgi:hypothetical protein
MGAQTITSVKHDIASEALDQAQQAYDDAYHQLKVAEEEFTFAARKLREARFALSNIDELEKYLRLSPLRLALDPRD